MDTMLDPMLYLRLRELVDILLISYLLHRLFLLFRGTAAQQILIWLVIFGLIQWFAGAAGLVLTSWFFQSFGWVAVIVFVVIFRNEIREALVQASPIRLVLGRPTRVEVGNPSAIVEAAFQMAETRTGALIVLQNREPLTEHAREGVVLNGVLSTPILESIFAKESPVHDGAVIVRGNRIDRVGTFLPLTTRPGLPAEFGTRHRAAIGISERSDAAVVVVSEERGEVSIVHRGEVHLAEEPPALVNLLHTHWLRDGTDRTRRRRIQSFFRHMLGFIAIFAGVSAFWWVYSERELAQTTVTTRVDFRNLPPYLELRSPSVESAEVQVGGKGFMVSTLRPEQVKLFVDLTEAEPGTHVYPLDAGNVELPPGLEIVRITPQTIDVTLEERVSKTLPVIPNFSGSNFEPGVILWSVDPPAITVNGPRSDVTVMKSLHTKPVDLKGITPADLPKTFNVGLELFPASLRLGENQPEQVKVIVRPKPQPNPMPEPPPPATQPQPKAEPPPEPEPEAQPAGVSSSSR